MITLKKKRSGFTLLEIVIVIIVIGVLASLALPRYFKTVEYARGFEALVQLGILRQSLNRYYVVKGNYDGASLSNLDVENPNTDPTRHFDYSIDDGDPIPGPNSTSYTLRARRNNTDNTNPPTAGEITMTNEGVKGGTGTYGGMR